MTSRAYGARSPRSHYNVILLVTSFATERATPTVTDERTDTLPRLIYEEDLQALHCDAQHPHREVSMLPA